MRKIFLAVIILNSLLQLSAQDSSAVGKAQTFNPNLYNHTSPTLNNFFNENMRQGAVNRVTADFDYSSNSNAVPASFGFDMIFKREIPDALKDRVDNRLVNMLKFEDFMKTGITYQRYLKKWGGSFYVSYNHREMRNITGMKQTYELLFYGNARFAGQTADLSNLGFQNFIYNQYSAGVKRTFDYGKYQMQFGVGLSFLQVINNQDIHTNKASLYTAEDGDTININYDLTFNTAKEGATNFFQLNGTGISGDFNFAIMNHDKWKLSLDISDVGSVSFRKTPVNYSGVNSVSFRGIAIPDLTGFTSQTFDTLNLDSTLRSQLPGRTTAPYSVALPFAVAVIFSKPLLHDRLVLNVGLQYRHLPQYYVYGFVKVNYFINPDMVVSGSAGAGGYSLFNLGFEFSKSWKYFDVAVGSSNLIGLILPSLYTGTGVYLRLAGSF